jgi:hypothetical protein
MWAAIAALGAFALAPIVFACGERGPNAVRVFVANTENALAGTRSKPDESSKSNWTPSRLTSPPVWVSQKITRKEFYYGDVFHWRLQLWCGSLRMFR